MVTVQPHLVWTCHLHKRVAGLRLFLRLVNYYGKFLTNLASTAGPLHKKTAVKE